MSETPMPNVPLHAAVETMISRLIYATDPMMPPSPVSSSDEDESDMNDENNSWDNNNNNNQKPDDLIEGANNIKKYIPPADAAQRSPPRNKNDAGSSKKKKKQQQVVVDKSAFLNNKAPCLASPIGWWTHRALNHIATIENEANQAVLLALHVIANHSNNNINDPQPQHSKKHSIVSILCGSDEVAQRVRQKLSASAAAAAAAASSSATTGGEKQTTTMANKYPTSVIAVRSLQELRHSQEQVQQSQASSGAANKKNTTYDDPSCLCAIFAFGFFPSSASSRFLSERRHHENMCQHIMSASRYCYILGQVLWRECDGPMRPVIEKASRKLIEMPLTIYTYNEDSQKQQGQQENNNKNSSALLEDAAGNLIAVSKQDVPDSSLFSALLTVRCGRHPSQLSVVSSSKASSLEDMRLEIRCSRLCRQPLRCGETKHLCTERCHSFDQHQATPCPFPCTRKLSCEHPCRKLCGEPCDCLKRVERELPCSHVTLKGNTMCHRYDGSCVEASKPCAVSIPVRCAHCFGITHVPCAEAQQLLTKEYLEEQKSYRLEQLKKYDGAQDIPLLPGEEFRCPECRSVEFSIRNQIKFELTQEAEEEKKRNRRDNERAVFEQERAARRGIFQLGQQAVISDTAAILDIDLASALFPDVEMDLWATCDKSELVNAVGAVTARQSDPTDPSIILYVLAVPTHGGSVAVPDNGLSLVRAVFGGDANNGQAVAPLLMIESRGGGRSQQRDKNKQVKELDPGTRVVVVNGRIRVGDIPTELLAAFLSGSSSSSSSQQHHDLLLASTSSSSSSSRQHHHRQYRVVVEEEDDEEEQEQTASEEVDGDGDGDAAAASRKNRSASSPRLSGGSSSSVIPISNIVGSVVRYEASPNYNQHQQHAPSYEPSSPGGGVSVVIAVDLVVYITSPQQQHHASSSSSSSSSLPQRRDRNDTTTTSGSSPDELRMEEVTLEITADASSVVPLFSPGAVVKVREPSRHVLDQRERERFAIRSHHCVGGYVDDNKFPSVPHHHIVHSSSTEHAAVVDGVVQRGTTSASRQQQEQQQQQQQQNEMMNNMSSSPARLSSSSASMALFLQCPLDDGGRCTIQGFANAPRASPDAMAVDTLLKTAMRRGPCYLVSSNHPKHSNHNSSINKNLFGGGEIGGGSSSSASTKTPLSIVPVFFADLDTDEISDRAVVSKIKEELDGRCATRMEEALDGRYIANTEAADRRMKKLAAALKQKRQKEKGNTKNTPSSSSSSSPQQQQSQQQQNKSYATVRIRLTEAAESEATKKYIAAKRFALGSHAAMLQQDDAMAQGVGGGRNSVDASQLGVSFGKERNIDRELQRGLLHQLR